MKRSFLQLRTLAFVFLGSIFLAFSAQAQIEKKNLKNFKKVVVSPEIDLVLTKGETEGITIEYYGVDREDIIFHVKGKTLSVYLEGARVVPNYETYWENDFKRRENVYKNAKVIAHVTYTSLQKIKVSGDAKISCHTPIVGDRLKIKLQGQNEAYFKYVDVEKLKVAVYGDNDVLIENGQVGEQRYKAIGESRIRTRNLESLNTSTLMIGESTLELNSSENLKVSAIGESDVSYRGEAFVNKKLMVGENKVKRIK